MITPAGPVELCGIGLEHPIINASGTFDAIAARRAFGGELLDRFPFSAYVSKTITPAELPAPLIVSVMATSAEQFAPLVDAVAGRAEVSALELNVSCPNVHSGLIVGEDPGETATLMRGLRPLTAKPLIVKLTPNVAEPATSAVAAEQGGADAVALINTIKAAPILAGGARWLGAGSGGLSGPAVRTIALKQVADVAAAVEIPVVGMGGVERGEHAAALLGAGASVVAVGTASFRDPLAAERIRAELQALDADSPVAATGP